MSSFPRIYRRSLKTGHVLNVLRFLNTNGLDVPDLDHFIAHPGGKKVLEAYVSALKFPKTMTKTSLEVLKEYGNMSSVTILYVLKRFMETAEKGDLGLGVALGQDSARNCY